MVMITNLKLLATCFFLVIFHQSLVEIGALHDGVILHFDVECGENSTEIANVTFLTDVDYVKAVAYCDNQEEYELTPAGDGFRSFVEVGYPKSQHQGCKFMYTFPGVDVFSIKVEVAHLVNGTLILTYDDVYSLTCSFGEEVDFISDSKTIDDSHVPSLSVYTTKGGPITRSLFLDVVGYDGNSFTGKVIPIGKIVRLTGEIEGPENITALRAFSCKALSYDETKSYDLLIGGPIEKQRAATAGNIEGCWLFSIVVIICGDGRIFRKDYGFTTIGNVTYSPYFKAFRMGGDARIKFQCQFTACGDQCEGSSCFKSKAELFNAVR